MNKRKSIISIITVLLCCFLGTSAYSFDGNEKKQAIKLAHELVETSKALATSLNNIGNHHLAEDVTEMHELTHEFHESLHNTSSNRSVKASFARISEKFHHVNHNIMKALIDGGTNHEPNSPVQVELYKSFHEFGNFGLNFVKLDEFIANLPVSTHGKLSVHINAGGIGSSRARLKMDLHGNSIHDIAHECMEQFHDTYHHASKPNLDRITVTVNGRGADSKTNGPSYWRTAKGFCPVVGELVREITSGGHHGH